MKRRNSERPATGRTSITGTYVSTSSGSGFRRQQLARLLFLVRHRSSRSARVRTRVAAGRRCNPYTMNVSCLMLRTPFLVVVVLLTATAAPAQIRVATPGVIDGYVTTQNR